MRKIYSVLVFTLFCAISYSQNFSVRYETGIGQYNMDEMKALQTDLKNMVSDLDVESVVQFPSTLYYGIQAEYLINKTNALGIHLFYNTTAGRNHLADYSGEYKMDILLSSFATGLDYRYAFSKLGQFSMSACLGAGIRFSSLRLKEDFTIYEDTILHSDNNADGMNIYTFPAFEISYPLLKELNLYLKAGYEIDFRSRYTFIDVDGPQILYNSDGKFLNVDYSGLRVGLGLSYNF